MINGFHLKYAAKELCQHLQQRAEHHHNRADTKEKELPGLREAAERVKSKAAPEVAMMSKTRAGGGLADEIANLEDQIRDHRNKALVFRQFAGHLFDEDYDLTESDLRRLEILK